MNHLHSGIIVGIVSASVCGASFAATVVERSQMETTQKITLDEDDVRINSPDPNFYTLMDLDKGKAYMVNTKEKRIVEMDIIGTPPKLPQDMMPAWQRSQPPQDRREPPPCQSRISRKRQWPRDCRLSHRQISGQGKWPSMLRELFFQKGSPSAIHQGLDQGHV
jgi:hypothetical protein